MYGDDATMATNYPLVRAVAVSDGAVSYWRTADHSTMGVATGTTLVSTTMRVPTDLIQGTYQVSVVANSIASDAVNIVFFLEPCQALQNRMDVLETLIQNDLDLLSEIPARNRPTILARIAKLRAEQKRLTDQMQRDC